MMSEKHQKNKELLDSLIEEMFHDLILNDENAEEKISQIVQIKQKWVAKLAVVKRRIKNLNDDKRNLINEKLEEGRKHTAITVSDRKLLDSIKKDREIQAIDNKLSEYDIVSEYIQNSLRPLSEWTWDIKNWVEMKKMIENG